MKGKALRKWKEIPIQGDVIENTFWPFKTPFDNTNISEEHQFTADHFVDIVKTAEHKVGLVIDLTKTDRYYDKSIIERKGIEHFKFPCRGYDETPTEEDTQDFVSKCKTFRKDNPDKLIVVHCTHGCNRTGFLICAYLIDIMNIDAVDAIKLFNNARPPGIHKQFVYEEILNRFGTSKESSEGDDFMKEELIRLQALKLGN